VHFFKELSQNSINSEELNSSIPTEPVVSNEISSPIQMSNNSEKKNKKRSENEVMKKRAFHILEDVYKNRGIKDEFTLLGEEVAMQVRTLTSSYARSTVKFKIQTLLYEARLGYYDEPQVNYRGNQWLI